MAIIKGAINFGSNFNIGAKGPIDARQRVETIADLTTAWTKDIPAYKDMVVAVEEDHNLYILTADDATLAENWKLIGGDTAADLTKVKKDVAANKAAIDKINGDASTTGSFAKGDADTLAAAKQYTDDAKTNLIGDDATIDTIKHAEKLATDASNKVDTKIAEEVERANAAYATAAQGTLADNAVRAVAEGKANGTISVTTGTGTPTDVKVKGLGSAAYTDSNAYATAAQGAKADSAIQSVAAKTGDKYITATPNGTSVEIASKGIDSAIKTAADAVKVSVKGGGYITGSTDAAGRVITLGSTTQTISDASATAKGLAEASDVKSYVDGKVSEINTAAGELGTRVTTLEGKHAKGKTVAQEVKDGIDGIAEASKANTAGSDVVVTVTTKSGSVSSVAVDSSVLKKAVTDGDASVKSDLLGDAATDYNTLGKLEDKIQEEASTARAAEKKNADAAAAAKTAADNAQRTADAKVKSVEGTNTVVATTTEHAVSVSLKTSDKGNVKFTQDTDGLSANVTIPPATVTGVKSGDKVLALDGTELTSTISLSIDTSADGDGKKYIRLKGINNADLGKIDIADFVKDGMLNSAELVTNPAGQSAGTYIKLTWNTDGGKDPMYINVTSLIDVYTAGNGLNLSGHEFSVNFDVAATKDSVDKVAGRVTTLEGKVGSAAVEGGAAATGLYKEIADEATRAKAAEEANAAAIAAETTRATAAEEKVKSDLIGTAGDDATKDTIKGAKQAVKDLKDQIEKDAVTLTIPEDDPYITASKDGNTNRYTISSKKDGTTPLVDVKINTKLTEKINSLDVTNNTSEAVKGITVTVNETDGIVSKPIVAVTPGSVAADDTSVVTGGAVYTAVDDAKSALLGTDGDAATKDTIKGAKKYTDASIAALDVTGNISEAVKGVAVTVDETDGKVIKPVVSIAAGTVGGASDANLVTGDTVKTYVDTAITNAALVWNDIPTTA